MGTKGYIHRKRYYLEYVCREGGFPDELGVEVLLDIPTEPEAFQKWLAETRKFLDEFKEDSNKYGDMVVRDEVDEEEELDDFMYMMNLDELSFGLWKAPMFRLDHMPPEDIFLRCIEGTDHYLQSTCRKDTPEEYRFTYSSPPPKLDEKMQTIYRNLRVEQPVVSVSRLLSRPEALSNREATRARLLEVTVSALMTQEAHVVQQASGLRDRHSLSERHIRCCSLLIQLAINPSFYITGSHAKRDVPSSSDTHEWWIRKHICVALTTHLDDENSLRDSVARLAERILAHEGSHITYGIAFDLLRIAIVRVDRLTKSVTHTEALSFTPSRYALSPSTPGIEALARLGDLSPSTEDDVAYYLHHYFVAHKHTSGVSGARSRERENASFRLGQLSAEFWARVAGFVEDGADLTNLALSSSKIARATLPLLKYPQIPTSRESTVILRSPCSRVFRPAERKSALARRKSSPGKDDDSDDDDDEDDGNESMEGSDSDTEEDEDSDEDSKPKGIVYDLTAAPFTIASNNVFCFAADHDEWCGWDNRQQEWRMIGDSNSPLEVCCKDVSFKFQRFVGKVIS